MLPLYGSSSRRLKPHHGRMESFPGHVTGTASRTAESSATCARARCKLREGQRGLCFVRAREGDAVVLTSYGAFQWLLHRPDREEAPESLPARHAGAVLRDRGLQPRLQVLSELGHLASRAKSTLVADAASPETLAGCPQRRSAVAAVAFTYNDPVVFMEYAIDVAAGLSCAGDTHGGRHGRLHVRRAPRREFYRHMDAANVDLKAFSETLLPQDLRRRRSRASSRRWSISAHETQVWFEITTLADSGRERLRRRA